MSNLEEMVREARAELGIDGREDAEFNALSPEEKKAVIRRELVAIDEALSEQNAQAVQNIKDMLDDCRRRVMLLLVLIRSAE